jgi:hypothetical protein
MTVCCASCDCLLEVPVSVSLPGGFWGFLKNADELHKSARSSLSLSQPTCPGDSACDLLLSCLRPHWTASGTPLPSFWGFELRAYILSLSTSPFFVKGFFELGSCELFAQAGFKLQSSRSLPPE